MHYCIKRLLGAPHATITGTSKFCAKLRDIFLKIIDQGHTTQHANKGIFSSTMYHTHVIKSCGLYIFYLMYGLYSRAASNQERLMMARVQYVKISYVPDNAGHIMD